MKQFQLELKIKEQENVILNQQIKHVQLKTCINDANQKKEQLITRTVSNMENEETAEDSMQKLEDQSRYLASKLSSRNHNKSHGNSRTFGKSNTTIMNVDQQSCKVFHEPILSNKKKTKENCITVTRDTETPETISSVKSRTD